MRFDVSQTQVSFEIDGKVIDKCNLHRILNVSENCIFKVMEEDEEELFFKVCIKYGEKIACYPELLENFAFKLRQEVNEDDEIKDEVYKLMRSGEDRKMACVEWNGTLTEDEMDKLRCLQMGSFEISTQFCKIGYWELEEKSCLICFIQHLSICYMDICRHCHVILQKLTPCCFLMY